MSSTTGGWRRTAIAFCALGLISAAPPPAQAEPVAFGAAGQHVVSGAVAAELEIGSGFGDEQGTARDITVGLSPSLLYFVTTDVAVGVSLGGAFTDSELEGLPYTELELSAAPGLGVHVALSDTVSFFPQLWVGAGYARLHYPAPELQTPFNDPSFGPLTEDTDLAGWFATAQLPLPLLLRLGGATYLAIGPRARLRVPFGDGLSLLRVGVSAAFGGFF
jgi:hypothetical protein